MPSEHEGPDGSEGGNRPEAVVSQRRVVMIIPCYNEAQRLDLEAFQSHAKAMEQLTFLFVDDGSSDGTAEMLEEVCRAHPESFELLSLASNRGKAEAVRAGILHAERSAPELVGYWDADLATPLDEIPRFVQLLAEQPSVSLVLGSRVNLLGRQVRRRPSRHYVSRTFATVIATALKLPVYDAQCGAKMLRATPEVFDLFRDPFHAKWIFDTEVLVRATEHLAATGDRRLADFAHELPLTRWEDVAGSKLRLGGYVQAIRDTTRIYGHHKASTRFKAGLGGLSTRVARGTRSVLRRISTESSSVSAVGRWSRAAVLVPVFGFLLVWMRLRCWLIGPLSLRTTTRSGLRFQCRLPDFIQTYLYLFGLWEPDLSAFIERRLEPGDTFVDVGANIGYHSLLADRAMGGRGSVVAIEASPAAALWLDDSLLDNGALGSVKVVRAAVSDHRGELPMYAGPANNVGLSTSVAGRGFPREAVVPCAPLPDLLESHEISNLRLLKIDVEGGEDSVVRGLGDLLDRARDDLEILIELSPQWWDNQDQTPADVLAPFFEAGFNAYEVDNNLWPWRYLWPRAVRRPKRAHRAWDERPRRIDLVMSRIDATHL